MKRAQALSGSHALGLAPELLDSIQLVISDVIMPGLAGPKLVELLCRSRPKLRSLLISGYPAEHRVAGHWFLPKPFGPSQLLRIVGDRLDAAE